MISINTYHVACAESSALQCCSYKLCFIWSFSPLTTVDHSLHISSFFEPFSGGFMTLITPTHQWAFNSQGCLTSECSSYRKLATVPEMMPCMRRGVVYTPICANKERNGPSSCHMEGSLWLNSPTSSNPSLFGIVQSLPSKLIAPTSNMQPKSDDATLLSTYTHVTGSENVQAWPVDHSCLPARTRPTCDICPWGNTCTMHIWRHTHTHKLQLHDLKWAAWGL